MPVRHALALFVAALSLPASALLAQSVTPTETPPVNEEEVVGTLDNDAKIAIPAFATNADVPTQTSAGSTSALGSAISNVIFGDLKNNGLFKPVGPGSLPRPALGQVQAPDYGTWQSRSADMLLQGYVRAEPGGNITVGCYLYDVGLGQRVASAGWTLPPSDWRRAAHKCADMVYSRLSGENPFFDSRIAYIAETGPKDRRMKRLAVMDSDGANHRYLTTGQSTALTPRFSPDYKQILYLSYFNGQPRIYIYDLGTSTQRLLLQSKNPLFAPRWSPDGRWILYSVATGGNTDIYKMPSAGGAPVKLTDSPGIDIGGSFSPDGTRIVFESDRSGSQQVYVMNSDGSGQKRISFFGGRSATPEWSPRGDQIAFTHIAGNFRIAVMEPGGGSLRYLTDAWQDEAPTWAPNGRVIQFFRTARGSGKTSIWQVDLTGKNERKLETPVDGSDPAWGPLRP
ncbi:MAG: Tol-Pal system beta propeller repeat protein TolB [Novosphingobium sp.]|uniref:Tol-Pal system beta propeller repeat protein TolB n=1 Tax=Novosphingobium sp. TaxID=1874826 RepID=UPI0032BE00D1